MLLFVDGSLADNALNTIISKHVEQDNNTAVCSPMFAQLYYFILHPGDMLSSKMSSKFEIGFCCTF